MSAHLTEDTLRALAARAGVSERAMRAGLQALAEHLLALAAPAAPARQGQSLSIVQQHASGAGRVQAVRAAKRQRKGAPPAGTADMPALRAMRGMPVWPWGSQA